MRVRDDASGLNGVRTLLRRTEVVSLLVVEEPSTVGLCSACVERLHVFLARGTHRLHRIGVGSSSIVNLI